MNLNLTVKTVNRSVIQGLGGGIRSTSDLVHIASTTKNKKATEEDRPAQNYKFISLPPLCQLRRTRHFFPSHGALTPMTGTQLPTHGS